MIRSPHRYFIMAVVLFMGFGAPGCSQKGVTTLQPDYEADYRERADAFDAAGHQILLDDYDGPFEIRSCDALQERAKRKPFHYSGLSSYDISNLVPCMIVTVLDEAGMPDRSFFPVDDQLGQLLFSTLDLTTFYSSLGPRLPLDHGNTFAKFFSKEAIVADRSFRIETDDWVYELTVDARADFDGDGIEDLLVVFYDNAKIATYYSIDPLILSRTEVDGRVTAQTWDEILRLKL